MSNENNAGVDLDSPTDIVLELREYAGNAGYSHGDYADTMRRAAHCIESLRAMIYNYDHLARRASATPSSKDAGGDLYAAALLAVERMRGCAATYIEDHAKDTYPGGIGLRPQDVATMWAQEIHDIDAKVFLDEAIDDLRVEFAADAPSDEQADEGEFEEPDHGETVLRVQEALGITRTGWVSPDVIIHRIEKLSAGAAAKTEQAGWFGGTEDCDGNELVSVRSDMLEAVAEFMMAPNLTARRIDGDMVTREQLFARITGRVAPSATAAGAGSELPSFKISRFSDTQQRGVLVTFERRLSDAEVEFIRAALARAPLPAQGDMSVMRDALDAIANQGLDARQCMELAERALTAPAQAVDDARDAARQPDGWIASAFIQGELTSVAFRDESTARAVCAEGEPFAFWRTHTGANNAA